MARLASLLALMLLALSGEARGAPADPWAGRWDVVADFRNGSAAGALTLARKGNAVQGSSDPLDEAQFFPLRDRRFPPPRGREDR